MQLKTLIIDDAKPDRVLLRQHICSPQHNIELLEAENAQTGLELMQDHHDLDCVFLDYKLPDMDGIDVLQKLYDPDTELPPFPIVILTGQGDESIAVEAIRYGAQDYLLKENISADTLLLALVKSRETYDLKKSRNDMMALLQHAQKMEVIGRLTGGIAHDFNNLLTITTGNVRILDMLLQNDSIDIPLIREKIGFIQRATKRGADLVQRLMGFSCQRIFSPATINLNNLIIDLEELLSRSLGGFFHIEKKLSDNIYNIDIDSGQLEHAIINMAINARDAMSDEGVFSIETKNVTLDAKQAQKLKIAAGEYVCLEVSDTGEGIPDDIINKIFDPFFTTKDVGQGSGLGLSMVYNFIKQSQGAVEVTSQLQKGTKFCLYFPRSKNTVVSFPEDNYTPNDTVPQTGHETILIVEDETDIRFLTKTILVDSGYTVLEAPNGHEGLKLLESSDQPIDLIFTDIAMPGNMNGVQMTSRAEHLRPGIKVLFTSGYADSSIPNAEIIKNHSLLSKPYEPEELIKKIREVLDAKK